MSLLVLITVAALSVAAVMTLVAWRLVRTEQGRFDARVAALAADIHGTDPTPEPTTPLDPEPAMPLDVVPPTNVLFNTTPAGDSQPADASRSRLRLAAAVGAVVLALVATGAYLGQDDPVESQAKPGSESTEPTAPVELVSLGHERTGGLLTIKGAVRDPLSERGGTNLTAVVLVFGRSGELIATAREPVAPPTDPTKDEGAFEIAVTAGADVGRYRVSFRRDEQVVPHLDRRAHDG